MQQVLGEADAGCRQLLSQHPTDPLPIQNALRAIHMKLVGLQQQVDQTWTTQIQAQAMSFGDNRGVIEQGTQDKDQLQGWANETWDRFQASWDIEALKAMWPAVQEEFTKPVACTQCQGPLMPTLRHKADSVRCPHCSAVCSTTPAQTVSLFYTLAPDAWAKWATIDKRFEIDRFRKQVEVQGRQQPMSFGQRNDEPIESLQRWESMEREYWTAYFLAKAQIMPSSNEDQSKMRDSRMQRIHNELGQYASWRAAMGPVAQQQSEDVMAPIEGVPLDQYAAIVAQQARGLAQADFHRLLAQQGMDPAKWDRVSAGWNERMSRDTQGGLMAAYAKAFAGAGAGQYGAQAQAGAAMMGGPGAAPAPAGVNPASVSFEQFCELMGAQNAWSMQGKDVNAMLKKVFSMSALDYSNISSYWSPRMMSDMSLAMRMTDLMMRAQTKYMSMP